MSLYLVAKVFQAVPSPIGIILVVKFEQGDDV